MPDPTPSMADLGINPEAAATLLPHIDSFVKWELLRFFHENPSLAATVDDLARYTGRDETELKPAARALVSAGLLGQVEGPEGYVYCLTGNDTLRGMVEHLIQGFVADRLVRLAVSAHILKALKAHRRASQPV